MQDAKHVLNKILGAGTQVEAIEATGHPLDQVVEILREVAKCRKVRHWLLKETGLEAALVPEVFHSLLDLPEIDRVEETGRDLEVTLHSLKANRQPGDPVSVANLNTVLRELYRDLSALNDLKSQNHPKLLLATEMTGDRVDRVASDVARLRSLDWRGVGYLLTGWKAAGIEKEFKHLFPKSARAHPLRTTLAEVELELGFYQRCLEVNIKWARTELDLFYVLREGDLRQVLQNLEELGNALWNIVYNGLRVESALNAAGLQFADTATLFDETRVPLTAA